MRFVWKWIRTSASATEKHRYDRMDMGVGVRGGMLRFDGAEVKLKKFTG